MQLPYSEELNIEYLGRLFDNTSECYKFFWFKAIVAKITEGKQEISYEELVDEMIAALSNEAHRCVQREHEYCYVPISHKVTLGEIVDLIYSFENQAKTHNMPRIPEDSFAKRLYSTYLSYLPASKAAYEAGK